MEKHRVSFTVYNLNAGAHITAPCRGNAPCAPIHGLNEAIGAWDLQPRVQQNPLPPFGGVNTR